jgi:hypothetical protein
MAGVWRIIPHRAAAPSATASVAAAPTPVVAGEKTVTPRPPVVRTLLDMTPPPGAKSDYPLGVNAGPPPGKVILTTDTPQRMAFPSASAGGIFPGRVTLLETTGKHRRLRVEEVWTDRSRSELLARHVMVGDHFIVSAAVGAERLQAALPPGFAIRRTLPNPGAFLVSFPVENEDSLPVARAALEKLGASLVKKVDPDTFVHTASIPNDPLFAEQWGLHNTGQDKGTPDADVDGPEAWDIRTDAAAFPIAVIDTGIDYTHLDLDANIWTNAGETGDDANGRDKRSNGADDDGNGYIDDWRGWDFANDDNDPADDNGHGTHIAGVIGAEGNNGLGIAGVCWSCRMMPLKALTANGGGAWSDIIDAVGYAKTMNARVGNLSFGAYGTAPEEVKTTFAAANETLWCAAAGNGELPHNGNTTGDDLDEFHFFPACLDVGHLISVTATGRNDALSGFANYGKFMVDIAAPGVAIRSTLPGGGYGLDSGTSMSCAYVTGFCALAWPLRVDPYPINVRQLALTTVKRSEGLRNKLVTRGRLDGTLFLTIAKSRMEWQMTAWGGVQVDDEHRGLYNSLGHCLQLRPDGTVMAWGNAAVATGNTGGPAYLATPVAIPLPSDARSVHATKEECFALLSDGTVWTWGAGISPQPHPVPISDVRFLFMNPYSGSTNALKTDGSMWSWYFEGGQFIDLLRLPISGRVTQAGSYYFLDDTGQLFRWGRGDGPVVWVAPFDGFPLIDRFIVVGGSVLATTKNGEAWGWGEEAQSGLPVDPANPWAPVRIPHWDGYLHAWRAREAGSVPAGIYVSMPDGKVLYAGPLGGNFLGTNPTPPPTAGPPWEVGGIDHMVQFTGPDDESGRTYALNRFGQAFRWDIFGNRPEFAPIAPLREFSEYQISGLRLADGVRGGLMLMAADFRGLYYGSNLSGVAGVGADILKTRPIELPALRGARGLQLLNYGATWAVMPDGFVHAWGGSAGYGDTESGYRYNTIIPTPAGRVVKEIGNGWPGASDGVYSPGPPLLIMEDGTLWQSGMSSFVQIPTPSAAVRFITGSSRVVLADGTTIYQPRGVGEFVPVSDDFVAFSGSVALKADGTVWLWMSSEGGAYSQLSGFSGITQIAGKAGLRNDGRLFVLAPLTSEAVMVDGLTNIVQIASGFDYYLALRADGELFTWGNNDRGQLGVGDLNAHLSIQQPYGLSDVVQIWSNGDVMIAKRGDGSFWGWGENRYGGLTDGSATILGAPNLAYGSSTTVFNAGNGFEDWLTTYFNEDDLRDVEMFADVKDPDDDGLVNLLEYGLGTNPRKQTIPVTITAGEPLPPATATTEFTTYVPTVRLEKVRRNYYSNGVGIAGAGGQDEETSHLVMTVPRAERRSDVDYIVEVSDDMEHWHFGPGHTVEVMNTLTNLVVYDARPVEPGRKRFIRLRLVRNNPGQTSIPR